ncbi:MAG: TolC family protein [Bacteroidales bacterium]|nr:TolC family protein [Bacteroidales bacterium]
MPCKKVILTALALALGLGATAQEVLTLDTCRARALRANSGLKRSEMKREETDALQKVALWQMLPKVSANGGYMWMQKSVNLLSEDNKERIGRMGDEVVADLGTAVHREFDDVPVVGNTIATRLDNMLASSNLGPHLNDVGNEIVQGLETDTRNMGVAAVTLTQPVYMGGKLLAAYRTARLLDELSGMQYDKEREALLVSVDEAYWQVVSVQHKKELAERYAALLDTLENNVQLAVEAEMATRGDLAKVRVKQNEAQMNLTKATNGLALAKMLLAQRCGMPLDADYDVNYSDFGDAMHDGGRDGAVDLDSVCARRGEMRMLRVSDSIAREGVRMAASTLKPNIVLTGGYLMSNPNVFDGFSNTWGGTWMAGVAVNVPLVHVGGIYAVKAAKAKRREIEYQTEEARELIELQVNKVRYELELAYKKKAQAESLVAQAEENLRLADESFKAGMCSSSDLMMAQTAWLQAQTELVDADIEIAMGKVYLKQATGEEL